MKMNLPNRLTVLRLCLVPVLLIVGMLPNSIIPHYVSCFVCAALCQSSQIIQYHDLSPVFCDGIQQPLLITSIHEIQKIPD